MNTPSRKLIRKVSDINWQNWEPHWTIKTHNISNTTKGIPAQTPHDFQERHAPTKPITIEIENITQSPRRRILDARLWNGLTTTQQHAALQIDYGFQLLSKGLGFRTSAPHLERLSGTRKIEQTNHQADLTRLYMSWGKLCMEYKTSHAACLDIIAYGKSCAEIDRARKTRKGWARKNLAQTLDLYCRLKGWPVG